MAQNPEDLKYTEEHEWARVKGRVVTVGITQFAQDQLGDVVYLELPEVGEDVKKGQAFGVVESTKAVSELFAPVSGRIVEINEPLVDTPEAINEDPYEEGWLVQIELSDEKELAALLDAAAYEKFVAAQAH